jgi:hypothetical protein
MVGHKFGLCEQLEVQEVTDLFGIQKMIFFACFLFSYCHTQQESKLTSSLLTVRIPYWS